jgi:C4-dicarboxylate-specific signal transduction histidine kinase
MIVSVKGWLEQIHNLRQRLDPQTAGRRGRATQFDVRDEIEDTFNLYSALLEGQGISHEIEAPSEPIKVRMARAALGQVLANLVDNSIFWLTRSGAGGRIKVTLERRGQGFAIRVNDSGPGVAPEDRTEIFEPYFTRKPNGIGLGLYIARLVIEPYGRLIYRDDCELPGACFEASFERSVGL